MCADEHHTDLSRLRQPQLQHSPHARPFQHAGDAASCHFLKNFVIPQQAPLASSLGYFEFVPTLLATAEEQAPCFGHAYKACAMAVFHNRYGPSPELRQAMYSSYKQALRAAGAAIQDGKSARKDHTLGAIILLGYFEQITAVVGNMTSWTWHVRGAVEIVRIRGGGQLNTKLGVDLFIAVRTRMVSTQRHLLVNQPLMLAQIVDSLQSGLGIPVGIDWWISERQASGPGWLFHYLTAKTSEIRAEANRALMSFMGGPAGMASLQDIIQKCKNHDAAVVRAMETLPSDLRGHTVGWAGNNSKQDWSQLRAFPGPIDEYKDIYVAELWNIVRTMRLVLGTLVVRCAALRAAPADYRTTSEYRSFVKLVMECITRIVASVPFLLGHTREGVEAKPSIRTDNTQQCLAGFTLMYPLMTLAALDYLTDAQRSWVTGRLEYISDCMGIRFGSVLGRVSAGELEHKMWHSELTVVRQIQVRYPSMLILKDSLAYHAGQLELRAVETVKKSSLAGQGNDSQRVAERKVLVKQVGRLKSVMLAEESPANLAFRDWQKI
ncbi:hypothetical protein PWT90_07600 [Aphanocladium album]|nr:hypothetical protein PWT90_07600 [Aphanocladium album]